MLLIDLAIIAIFSALVTNANQTLLLHAVAPPESNGGLHLSLAASYDCAMRNADTLWQALVITWVWPGFYPASSYLITYIYSSIYGTGIISAFTSVTVLVPVLIASIYCINRQRYGILAGICGIMASLSIPQGLLFCNQYPSDFQVGTGVCLTIWALFNCDSFSKRTASWLFGLCLGFSLMFKSNVIWFIIPAALPLLIGQWRDICSSRLNSLWQTIILLAAAASFGAAMPHFSQLQADMTHFAAYTSPQTVKMLAAVGAICLIWWVLSCISLGKYPKSPRLAHLNQALCLSSIIAAPWVFVNHNVLTGHNGSFLREQIMHFTNAQTLKRCFEITICENSFGLILSAVLAISLLMAFTKWADAKDRSLALTSAASFCATALLLGESQRYYLPVFLVSSCCLVAPLRRSKWLMGIFIAVAACNFGLAIIIPAYYPDSSTFNSVGRYGFTRLDRSRYPAENPNRSVYAKVWQVCPALKSPNGEPVGLALYRNRQRVNNAQNGFGYDPIEDANYAAITRFSWRQSDTLPFFMNTDGTLGTNDMRSYLPYLSLLSHSFPTQYADLYDFVRFAENDSYRYAIQQHIIGKCQFLLDISTDTATELDETSVSNFIVCPNPAHYTVTGDKFTLHIWCRPECAPAPASLELPENLFIPYMP
ncbi:glycosyltransferase family 39 protein [bacterium]|nr:glycosyltransferase family 39 protein [bacterium]